MAKSIEKIEADALKWTHAYDLLEMEAFEFQCKAENLELLGGFFNLLRAGKMRNRENDCRERARICYQRAYDLGKKVHDIKMPRS